MTITTPSTAGEYELADVGTRFIALVIDGVILAVIGFVVGLLIALLGIRNGSGLIGLIIGIGYQVYYLTQKDGQTLGKKAMGIRVIKVNGQPLSAADAVIRYVGYSIDTLVFFIGWIWALFDANKQAWHDKLAGTYVVRA